MDFGICFSFLGGRGWTELSKEAPGFRSYLAPTPATLRGLPIIRERSRTIRTGVAGGPRYRYQAIFGWFGPSVENRVKCAEAVCV